MSTLVTQEVERLGQLENTIAEGMRTFIAVGNALAEIRSARLYRDSHDTFEDYCRERWDFSKVRATQFITAAMVTMVTTENGTPGPANERVARELAPLRDEPVNLREAWQEAVEQHGEKPTAVQVHEVVQAKVPEPEPEPAPYTTCPVCRGRGGVRTDKPLRWTRT